MRLEDKLAAVSTALRAAEVPHAFGGAIALAYALNEARATIDLDLNVFLPATSGPSVVAALPPAVAHDEQISRQLADLLGDDARIGRLQAIAR